MARVNIIRFRFIVSTIITEAKLKRKIGIPAVLIFRNVDVVSRMASGVPIILTKLSERTNRIAARTQEKRKIVVIDVLIGYPGPSLLCIPLPTKKNMARTKVSCTTSSRSSMNCHWATVASALVSGIALPIK